MSAADAQVTFAEIVRQGNISHSLSEDELAALPIKPAAERAFIGKSARALDIPEKTKGTAVYGIDVELPGMVFAHPLIPPTRYGSSIKSIDDSAAKTIAGYQQTLQLNDPSETLQGWAVVIADDYPSAMKAAAAVVVDWDAGPTATVSEADILAHGEKLAADTSIGTRFVDEGELVGGQQLLDIKSIARAKEVYQG